MGSSRRRMVVGTGVTLGAAFSLGSSAQAAVDTITVTSLGDPGDGDCATNGCTLREAIAATNDGDATDVDQITFASNVTGDLHLQEFGYANEFLPHLTITDAVDLIGPGAGTLAIYAPLLDRVLAIDPVSAGDDVSISGLTLTDGNPGTGNGAGIDSRNADLTLENDVISGNGYYFAAFSGGGIFEKDGTLTIEGSTISNNYSNFDGAPQPRGGGIAVSSAGATTINDSTISGNGVTSVLTPAGGGISATGDGALTITNSTISGNYASASVFPPYPGSYARAGGIYDASDAAHPLTIRNSTVADNFAFSTGTTNPAGAGIWEGGAYPTLTNSIVAHNVVPIFVAGFVDGPDISGSDPFDAAFSLIQKPGGATINSTVPGSNITGVDPRLASLADNGGSTQTMVPGCGSPVIDKGSAFSLTEDQRGFTRPVELGDYSNSTAAGADGSDIGAVELQTSPGTVCTPPPPPPGGSTPVTPAKKKCKKKKKSSAQSTKKKKCKKKKHR